MSMKCKKGKRAAIYVRVSTAEQNTQNQRRELEAVAERHGWTVTDTYEDAGISGAKGRNHRPGLAALMKAVARRECDIVAAWSVDRLGRSLPDLLDVLKDLHAKDVDLYLHQQGLDGGRRLRNEGSFYAPTVLADVPESARIMNEEPFGPVAVINRFEAYEEALAKANRLPYGLAAFAFSSSPYISARVADDLEAGMVGINSFNISTPEAAFGGVKESGQGSEMGIEGIEAYLVTKTISMTP